MLTFNQIREIARHQRLRGVEVVGVKGEQGSVRIRISAAPIAATTERPAATGEVTATVAAKGITVRSDRLGTIALSGRSELATPLQTGDAVDKGQVMAVVELGEDVSVVVAPARGSLSAVLVQPGQRVDYGMPLFELTPGERESK